MHQVDWFRLIVEEDVEALWEGLYRAISRHPAVRPLHSAADGSSSSRVETNADLTQELFLELFQKRRFDHYIKNGYNSSDIENELIYIEIPNLVGLRLRKRYPESFRIARRVSSILQRSPRFRRFDVHGARRPRRVAFQLFGLSEWPDSKPAGDPGRFHELIEKVPARKRDTRKVGRGSSSQLIISNKELEELIVEILQAIDSPADVRTIRQLVASKLNLQDCAIASIEGDSGDGPSPRRFEERTVDTRDTPEMALLREEKNREAAKLAEQFLDNLRRTVNHNQKRYYRLLRTLWLFYYDARQLPQIEIARILGVSDSLISENRKLIMHELKKLRLSIEEGEAFSESLRRALVERGLSSE
jgi:hypothetical protein